MQKTEFEYLEYVLYQLERVLPRPLNEMTAMYRKREDGYMVSEDGYGYISVLFGFWEDTKGLERVVLVVLNENDDIIADTSAYVCSMTDFLCDENIYDKLSLDSDWTYLEHYVLSGTMFDELPYPYCKENKHLQVAGIAMLYTNAYVQRRYRKHGIFTGMVSMMQEYALKKSHRKEMLYSVFAMDPDIACFGEDTVAWPYVYSREKDEPDRIRNGEIAEKLGYEVIRLEETDPDPDSDGTKIWFCVKKEEFQIIEESEEELLS